MQPVLNSQWTKEGLVAARTMGRNGGRPAKDKKDLALALKMYHGMDYDIKDITKATGISKPTYRYLKLEAEKKQAAN